MRQRFSPTPVAGTLPHHTASRVTFFLRGDSNVTALPAAGLLCHYDCGRLAVAYVSMPFGAMGWCAKHLSLIGDWPARHLGEMG